jgi:hypothetical protein
MQILVQETNVKDDKVSKIVERVLTQIFGREATHLIYKHLERKYSVKPSEVGEKLELFTRGLEDFLRSGAYAIERKILEDAWLAYGSARESQLEKLRDGTSFVSEMRLLLKEA